MYTSKYQTILYPIVKVTVFEDMHFRVLRKNDNVFKTNTVNSRYLEVQGTLLNTLRYPFLDIPNLQNLLKNK